MLAEAFCILRDVLTKIHTWVQLDDASIGFKLFNLIFGRKIQFIVFMLRVFIAHFSPVKCSKTIFRKRAKPLVWYRGTIQSGHSIKCPRNTPDTYISSISFLLQVSSLPISIIYQYVLATHPIPWHGGGISGQMYHVLIFCIVPLVQGKCAAFDIQRQIWQYKVKHDRWWRKLPWF